MMDNKQIERIILFVFVIVVSLVGVLAYGQGRWDGMKRLCPEPNILGMNRTGSVICYSPESGPIKNDLSNEDFNLEDYLNGP